MVRPPSNDVHHFHHEGNNKMKAHKGLFTFRGLVCGVNDSAGHMIIGVFAN